MRKIGITGSLSSGKTTASQILSSRRGPLFSADTEVRNLYKKKSFIRFISKKFNLSYRSNIRKYLREKILKDKKNIKKLEKIIHPLVRSQMQKFIKKNKRQKLLFFEIPLLVESKLMKNFNLIIFIKDKKKIRLKRFISKGGNKKLFNILNKKQFKDSKKAKFCDYVIVNEKNKEVLKKNLKVIMQTYE